jgi:hypothetical protein
MRSRPGRLIRRLASWPRVLAIVATGMHVIGWGRVGRAGLTLVRGVAGATWPALRLVWPGLVVLAIAGLLTHRGRALLARVRIGVRFPWLVGALALAVFGLVVLSLLVFPRYLVQRSLDATGTPTLSAAGRWARPAGGRRRGWKAPRSQRRGRPRCGSGREARRPA